MFNIYRIICLAVILEYCIIVRLNVYISSASTVMSDMAKNIKNISKCLGVRILVINLLNISIILLLLKKRFTKRQFVSILSKIVLKIVCILDVFGIFIY